MISEQLELDLRMPWNGVSPRYLTSCFAAFSLSSEGTGRSNLRPLEAIDVDQIELFPEGTSYGTSKIIR